MAINVRYEPQLRLSEAYAKLATGLRHNNDVLTVRKPTFNG